MTTDREAMQQAADILNNQLANGGGTTPPPTGGDVAPILSRPNVSATLPDDGGVSPVKDYLAPNQVVGLEFNVRQGTYHRQIDYFGTQGGGFTYTSWAVFDSVGNRLRWADNVNVTDQGVTIPTSTLQGLAPGSYVLGLAVNAPAGWVAARWNQQ